MSTAKEIKEEMQFNTELKHLLEVMRDIAVFQFRTLQRKKARFVRFAQNLKRFFEMVDFEKTPGNFINPTTDRSAIVMITSDEGFMGGLNLQVINSGIMQPKADDAQLIIVGERGQRYLREMNRECVAFRGAEGVERYNLALNLRDFLVRGVKNGKFGRVFIFYPKPVSFMVQKVEVEEILPIQTVAHAAGHTPHAIRGAWSVEREAHSDVIIESPMEGIIEYLVEEMVLQRLLEVLEDSKLSEFAARAIHLEKSSRELDDKAKLLRMQYFHAYHEIIDQNTRELFSAQIIRRRH